MNAREYLEAALGYRFRSPEPLTRALCHSSWINEHPDDGLVSNQRLEFLGDAVLNLVVSHLLMERYPSLTEGELSRTRAYLVNESQLAAIARQIGLGPCLLLGKGEAQSDGRKKNSILADGVEAVIAAVYLDGGFDAAFAAVSRQFSPMLMETAKRPGAADYKSRLQELAQSAYRQVPRYTVIQAEGPDHDKTFRVRVTVAGISAEGEGKSKKLAEQEAARQGLVRLEEAV